MKLQDFKKPNPLLRLVEAQNKLLIVDDHDLALIYSALETYKGLLRQLKDIKEEEKLEKLIEKLRIAYELAIPKKSIPAPTGIKDL